MAGHSANTANAAPLSGPIIPQFLHYQRRNWYFHHNTTTKTPNLAREHINNDRQEREEDIGLPVAFKDNLRLAGMKRDKEELGDVPRSISAPSRNVDELLPPLPIIDGVGRLSGKLPSGEYLQWTPQIQLEDNGPSINDPPGNWSTKVLVDGGGKAFIATDEKLKCSNVQRLFINKDTCFLSSLSTACSATNPVGKVLMPVNTTFVLNLYDLTGREIYAIQSLVMESIMELPCAKTRSRWVVQHSTTCSVPSILGTNTITALTAAITASINKNAYVTDVDRTLACNPSDFDLASDLINIQLQVGPDCYTHVHPNHLNVYEFTGWVTIHPGGSYHIQKWAQGCEGHPGWYLIFLFYGIVTCRIPEHPMNRWVTRAKEPAFVKVASLGNNIAY